MLIFEVSNVMQVVCRYGGIRFSCRLISNALIDCIGFEVKKVLLRCQGVPFCVLFGFDGDDVAKQPDAQVLVVVG